MRMGLAQTLAASDKLCADFCYHGQTFCRHSQSLATLVLTFTRLCRWKQERTCKPKMMMGTLRSIMRATARERPIPAGLSILGPSFARCKIARRCARCWECHNAYFSPVAVNVLVLIVVVPCRDGKPYDAWQTANALAEMLQAVGANS